MVHNDSHDHLTITIERRRLSAQYIAINEFDHLRMHKEANLMGGHWDIYRLAASTVSSKKSSRARVFAPLRE